MAVPKLVSDRLTLREIKSKDIFAHTALFSDQQTMELFGGHIITNDLELKDVINTKKSEFENGNAIFWVITLTEDKEFIGFARLMSYNSHYFDSSYSSVGEMRHDPSFHEYINKDGWEIDYALLKDYRGKGIMSEAIDLVLNYCSENKLSPLYAKVNSLSNKATISLLKKKKFVDHLPLANRNGGFGMIFKMTL
ncbi:ribosomal-protein-amino-adic N-acetyltransferase [Flammeovirgaceae bacterium 311]|nr:ribosomal-protein-amino-adic N-acetyltransferase [Flammeovirgaceae bacterium 311]